MIEHKLASGSSPSGFLSFNGHNKRHTVVDPTEHFCSNIVNETTSISANFFTQKIDYCVQDIEVNFLLYFITAEAGLNHA